MATLNYLRLISGFRRFPVLALMTLGLFCSAAQAQVNIYIVRHGQTDWNKEGRIQGGTDNPLNSTGLEQAATMARTLADIKIDAIYTSSHQRARQTAQVLQGRAPITALDDLRERFFGKFEGANDKDTAIVADWNKRRFTWADDMEGGETLQKQTARAESALQTIRAKHKDGDNIVIVGHGGINPLLASLLLGVAPQEGASAINQGNDEIYRIEITKSNTAQIWKLIPKTKLSEL